MPQTEYLSIHYCKTGCRVLDPFFCLDFFSPTSLFFSFLFFLHPMCHFFFLLFFYSLYHFLSSIHLPWISSFVLLSLPCVLPVFLPSVFLSPFLFLSLFPCILVSCIHFPPSFCYSLFMCRYHCVMSLLCFPLTLVFFFSSCLPLFFFSALAFIEF